MPQYSSWGKLFSYAGLCVFESISHYSALLLFLLLSCIIDLSIRRGCTSIIRLQYEWSPREVSEFRWPQNGSPVHFDAPHQSWHELSTMTSSRFRSDLKSRVFYPFFNEHLSIRMCDHFMGLSAWGSWFLIDITRLPLWPYCHCLRQFMYNTSHRTIRLLNPTDKSEFRILRTWELAIILWYSIISKTCEIN